MKQPSLIETAFFLKKVRLFAELDLELLLAIAEKLHFDDYDANELIFSPAQPANRMYLIYKGSVQLIDAQGRAVSDLHPTDSFGDEALFSELPRAYTAVAKSNSLFFTLSRSHLLSILSECPSVALTLLQSYATSLPLRTQ